MRVASLAAVGKILLGAGATALVSYALGRWFLRATGVMRLLSRAERVVFGFGLGAACLSTLVFALCAARLAYTAVFVVVGVAILAASFRRRGGDPAPVKTAPARGLWLLLPIALCYGYLYLANAMAPEVSADGAGYHLGLVYRYLREHGFTRYTTNIYGMLSQGTEMLFLFAFTLGRHSAAKLTHFLFLPAAIAAMIAFGRRFLPENQTPAAAVGAAFFALSPVVGADATCSYNDCALAFFTFLTFYLLLLWDRERDPALPAAIGVAAGFCFAIKYTGFLAVPFALAFVARERGRRLGNVAKVAAAAAVFIVPWMLKNAILIGNPVAPFFSDVFQNPYVHAGFTQTYGWLMRHYGGIAEHDWRDYRFIPLELAVRGAKLQGVLGPLFLLAPVALVSLRDKVGRRLCLAAAIFALPWLGNIGTRFLIPALVFLSLAIALAIWQLRPKMAIAISALLVAGHAVASWPAVMPQWCDPGAWRLGSAPWRVALRREPEADYLGRVFPDYHIARMVERLVPPRARIYSTRAVPEAYTRREILTSYVSALSEQLTDDLVTPIVEDYAPRWTVRFEWEPRELAGIRLIQTGAHEQDFWSINELTFYSGEDSLLPDPGWLLRARPNPWDAALALDGNPATRWRSWTPLTAGMRFQVDFPAPVRLSRLDVHCSSDQYSMALRLDAKDAAGRWTPLTSRMDRIERNPERQKMKRLSTDELKRNGVDYVMTEVEGGGLDLIGRDIAKDPGAWGLRQVGEYGPVRLYVIE